MLFFFHVHHFTFSASDGQKLEGATAADAAVVFVHFFYCYECHFLFQLSLLFLAFGVFDFSSFVLVFSLAQESLVKYFS